MMGYRQSDWFIWSSLVGVTMPPPGSYLLSGVDLSDAPSANRARKTKILEKISYYSV
jgi:hypothetical protein